MSTLDELEQLKCSNCKKYLTLFPIHKCTNENCIETNICGRCDQYKFTVSNLVPCPALETAVKFVEFPCTFSNCATKLRWDSLQKHEDECPFRTMACSICKELHTLNLAELHFRSKHKEYIKKNEKITAIIEGISNKTFLSISDGIQYVVTIQSRVLTVKKGQSWLGDYLDTKHRNTLKKFFERSEPSTVVVIQKLRHIANHNYNLIITLKENSKKITLHKGPIVKDIFTFPIKFRPLFRTFGSNIIDNFTIEIEISNLPKSEDESRDSLNFLPQLSAALKCPMCTRIMKSNIFTCKQGHSVCHRCKCELPACPICRLKFKVRNYALEEISKIVEHLFSN